VRRLASIVAILLLLTAAVPVMACVTNVVISHEESACCRPRAVRPHGKRWITAGQIAAAAAATEEQDAKIA